MSNTKETGSPFFNGIFAEHDPKIQRVLERCVLEGIRQNEEADPEIVLKIVASVAKFDVVQGLVSGRINPHYGSGPSSVEEVISGLVRRYINRRCWWYQKFRGRVAQKSDALDVAVGKGGVPVVKTLSVRKERIIERLTIRELLNTAPPRDQEVIRMYYWEERSHAEIASILGSTEEYSRKILEKARARLRAQYMQRHVPFYAPPGRWARFDGDRWVEE